jgi:alanine racemase
VPRAEARVDLLAIERNAALVRGRLSQATALCAVVKADGYGHGAVPSARAALAGGATWLGVVTGREAAQLRAAGIEAPILAMGALDEEELAIALEARADVAAWSPRFVAKLGDRPARVHVKLDTGFGRLGTRDPEQADATVAALGERAVGLWTHFATADERGDAFFGEQLARFAAWALPHRLRRPELLLHAANSAATLRSTDAHFDLVRCGIALYGLDPFGEDARAVGLEPALQLRSYVATLKPCAAGESAGYGRRFVCREPTRIATLPIGYGDGWRRGLSNNAEVVIRGRRYPLVGAVSMDNVTIDVGLDSDVRPGDEALLIGGGISAEEVARRLGTINYEVTTGLLPRTLRAYHRGGAAVDEAAQPVAPAGAGDPASPTASPEEDSAW